MQGMRFYHHAREIIERCEAARRSLSEASDRPPAVRIGVLRTLAAGDIAAAHAALQRGRTDWRWSLREGSEQELAKWLSQRRIDVAWTTVDEAAGHASVLWRELYVAMLPPQHRLAQGARPPLRAADLTDELFVLRGACELKQGTLQAAGLRMKVVARAERDDLALRLVAAGAGIAIAPQSLATADVVSLPVIDLELSRCIGLRHRSDAAGQALETVADALRAVSGFRSQSL
jgi:DNA-binding transcriptional LysR family regulator